MSRKINQNPYRDSDSSDTFVYDTQKKFLVFYTQDTYFTFLIQNNRIIKVESSASSEKKLTTGTILIAKVENVLPQMNGCFLRLNSTQNAFLSFEHGLNSFSQVNRKPDDRILPGDEVVVMITKEAQRKKPIQVSSFYEIATIYSVLKKGNGKIQLSSKFSSDEKKNILEIVEHWKNELDKEQQDELTHMDLLIRTKALRCTEKELRESLYESLQKIKSIDLRGQCGVSYEILYQPEPSYLKIIEDQVLEDFDEIVTDNETIYQLLKSHSYLKNLPIRFYQDPKISLSRLYALNTKLRELLSEKVFMKSGAYIVIEQTEALVSIDVNSGKKAKKTLPEEYYFQCNMEAVDEILYQLTVRNLSGMILIDFINMREEANVTKLIHYIQKSVKNDSVTTTYVDYTKLGLVELTRKKTATPLKEKLHLWDWESF